METKSVFLDRDGVINVERGTYTFRPEDFVLIEDVRQALELLKRDDFRIIVITNQSGISQGIYSMEDMEACHQKMQQQLHGLIDDVFYCRWHPKISESIMRKPDSLMLERAIALYDVDIRSSWMVGDKERDIIPARKLGLNSILIGEGSEETKADHVARNLFAAVREVIMKV